MTGPAETIEVTAAEALVADLNRRHVDMMARLSPVAQVSAEERAAFIDEVKAAGRVAARKRSRDALRNMLLFWAMDAVERGERPADAPVAMIDDLVEIERPVEAASEERPVAPAAAPSRVDAGGSALSQLGSALRSILPGSAPPSPPTAPASGPVPAPTGGDDHALDRARTVMRYSALARQWLLASADAKKGLLLSGAALTEARGYAKDDPDISAFVEASEDQEKLQDRRRKQDSLWFFGVLGIAVLFIALFAYGVWARWQLALNEKSIAAAIEERDRTESEARHAVDVLAAGNVNPVKALLRRLARAEPREVERLTLSAPRPTVTGLAEAPSSVANVVTRAPVQRTAPQAAVFGTCSGALWLGSAGDGSKIDGIADPATVTAGSRVTTSATTDIRLRADLPKLDDYTMARQTGLVPGGSIVTVNAAPVAYQRTLGVQFWANVTVPRQYCASVFIQYFGRPEDQIAAMRTAILGLDMQAPGPEQTPNARGLAEVRYFLRDDAALADRVAKELSGFNGGRPFTLVPLLNFPGRVQPGTIEVWTGVP